MLEEWGAPKTKEKEGFVYTKPKPRYSDFQVMYSSLDKKFNPTLAEKEKISEFLFGQILSNHEQLLDLALLFTTKDIPNNKQYDFVRFVTPKMYIPFPSKKKGKTNESIDAISEYYKCSIEQATIYYEMMPDYEIERIKSKFSEGRTSKTKPKN